MLKFSVLISAFCVTLYWLTVVFKSIILSRKIGKHPLPHERIGQLTRVLWAPTIIVWIMLLWRGAFLKLSIHHPLPVFIEYSAAMIVIIATALTFWCWHQMGTSWRIGIDPLEKTQLIVTGPYRYVLHPIYSLSMVLALATLCTFPTYALLCVIAIHLAMLNIEAHREEKYLLRTHGESYRQYQESVGRFVPRWNSQLVKQTG